MSDESNESSSLGTAILFGVLGIVFAVLALWHHLHVTDLANNGLKASGSVVDIEETRGRRGRTNHYPVVQFSTETGQSHRVKTSQSKGYTVGQPVTVLYKADKPEVAEIEGSAAFDSFSLWAIMTIISLGLAGWNAFRHFT